MNKQTNMKKLTAVVCQTQICVSVLHNVLTTFSLMHSSTLTFYFEMVFFFYFSICHRLAVSAGWRDNF